MERRGEGKNIKAGSAVVCDDEAFRELELLWVHASCCAHKDDEWLEVVLLAVRLLADVDHNDGSLLQPPEKEGC
jgi:hypothetical protein